MRRIISNKLLQQGHQKTKMKSLLTSYSQLSLLSPLRSRIENRCCHEPTYLLKTGLSSFACFTTWRCNRFTCQATTSATTANFSSKDFYPTQLHTKQDRHAKPEGRPFYPKSFLLSENRNNPKNIIAKNEFSVLGVRKRLPLGAKQRYVQSNKQSNYLPCARVGVGVGVGVGAKQHQHQHQHGQQISKEEIFASRPKIKRATLGTHLCEARTSKCSEKKIPASVLGAPHNTTVATRLGDPSHGYVKQSIALGGTCKAIKQSTGTKVLDTTPCSDLPARLSESFLVHRTGRGVFERSFLPEKFINLLMANGEKDKARRCLTQALFSITTHCQKHNLQNNSPLKIFTDSFFKQESTESKPSTAHNSLQRASTWCEGSTCFARSKGTVQQKTGTNELLPLLPKDKNNTLLYVQSNKRTGVESNKRTDVESNKQSKRNANPGKSSNVLRDVGLVLLETRLDNLFNGRYSGAKKRKLYPSVKEGQRLLSMAKGTSIFRLSHIERVEKRLLSKQNGFFFLFVKQKGKLVAGEKQTGKFKLPLSLPFCGKSFETTFPVFLPLRDRDRDPSHGHQVAKQNNPFLSLIRLSLKERFLISEKGFAFLALHKKVQQSYLCSALLHLYLRSRSKSNEKRYQILATSELCEAIKRTKYRTYTTTLLLPSVDRDRDRDPSHGHRHQVAKQDQQQIHFLPFLPYSALFNWREKSLNPLFGFAKQSQRFLLELCKASANRSVKGTEKIRQNNPFGSFPLLSCFYSARTPSSLFSCVATPSIIIKFVGTRAKPENNPFSGPKAKKSSSYKDEYVQQDTKLETKGLDKFVADLALRLRDPSHGHVEMSDRLVLLNGSRLRDRDPSHGHGHVVRRVTSVASSAVPRQEGGKEHKQPPQNLSHSNTKEKKTPHCFTQGIPPLAKKVFSQEKDAKSVHTEVLLKGIQRVQPTLEVRRVRKGRNTFQVPSVVKQKRGEKVGIKWIIDSAKRSKRKGNKLFSDSLANQLVQSFDRLGEARSKRNELLKLAESNRPFLRFRWW